MVRPLLPPASRAHRIACGALWILAAPRLFAACIDYSQAPRVVGQFDVPLAHCQLIGHLGYVTTQGSEFRVVDLSDPALPTTLGRLDVPNGAWSLAVSGTLAYVLTNEPGLVVIDVADIAMPRIVGQMTFPAYGQSIAVEGGLACVPADEFGLLVLDVANPMAPRLAGSVDTPGFAHGIAMQGTLAYVTDATSYPSSSDAALHIVDLSNAASPRIVGTLTDYLDSALDVDLRGPFAYISDRFELRIVGIANPSAPLTVGRYPMPAFNMVLDGPRAYVAVGGHPGPVAGFAVLDTSNPLSPITTALLADLWTGSLAASNGVVVACGPGSILDVKKADSPGPLAQVTTQATCGSLSIVGSYAYLCEWDSGFEILAVTSPTSMTSVGFVDTPALAADVEIAGSLAYVADAYSGDPSALLVIDVSTPQLPVIVQRTDTPGEALALDVSGGFAYIADGGNGLVIADLSAPQAPFLRGNARIFNTQMFDVVVREPYAYLAAGNAGLVVANVANPDAPAIVTNRPAEFFAEALAVEGNWAYLVGNGLEIIDVSEPSAPVSVASLALPAANAIAVHGTLAYLTSGSTLYVVDISNSVEPRLIGSTSEDVSSNGVAVFSGHVYVMSGSGLSVFPPHCDLPVSILDQPAARFSSPHLIVENPSRGSMSIEFAPAYVGDVHLRVFDARGRFVRQLFRASAGPEPRRMIWDGRDHNGTSVANGVYFVQMLNAGMTRVRRGVLLR